MDEDIQHFGLEAERAIISLCLDQPEFYHSVGQHVEPKNFEAIEAQYVFGKLQKLYEEHEIVPTRELLLDVVRQELKVDDDFRPIVELVTRESDPREVPIIKKRLVEWVRGRAYAMLYDEEAIVAYERGNYDMLDEIVDKAQKITDISQQGINFFDHMDLLFKEDAEQRFTSGFGRLDRYINEGGPTRGDVTCFMAPTGVGKSIILVNTGAANLQANKNVLHVTLELSYVKTMMRYMGALTGESLKDRIIHKNAIKQKLTRIRNSIDSNLINYEFPPDEISVDTIYQIVDWLKKHMRWAPDIVILDYLDLLMSRRDYNNKEDYVRQKRVATEIRGLAQGTGTCIFTATQTHRQAETDSHKKKDQNIGLNKIAESYGKAMPLDYIISMNQTETMYNEGQIRLFIIKNRNGPKFKAVSTNVNYSNMKMEQAKFENIMRDLED